MGDFFAELRRRHIYRIGAGYLVVAWGMAQVVDLLSQIYALPAWIAQPVVAVLAIGFPITLIVAWLIEGKAHEAVATAVRSPATKVDWILAGALVAVLAVVGYQQLTPGNVSVARVGVLPNSIAVLPFDNLSTDPENAFFAAGIHDTLLNELAKISAMNVISRTSVLRYADGQTPISQIAAELNVETVMEGTVQYADGRVLVTAQLIDPESEVHLWSENYDREFEGIFAIQADIAMNIANALQAEFSVTEQESIEKPLTRSPEASELFLRAMALVRTVSTGANNAPSRGLIQDYLDEAIEQDANFAMAYAWKANVYRLSKIFDPVTEDVWLDFKSEMDRLSLEYANMALALDPSIGVYFHLLDYYVCFKVRIVQYVVCFSLSCKEHLHYHLPHILAFNLNLSISFVFC